MAGFLQVGDGVAGLAVGGGGDAPVEAADEGGFGDAVVATRCVWTWGFLSD